MHFDLKNKVEKRRKELSLLKKDIYQRLEMTPTGYSTMMNRGTTTISTLLKIADVLEVEPSYFFSPSDQSEEHIKNQKERERLLMDRIDRLEKDNKELRATINALSHAISQLTSMQSGKPKGSGALERLRLLPIIEGLNLAA